jgi:cell wall-associated NlpC family hydrolase
MPIRFVVSAVLFASAFAVAPCLAAETDATPAESATPAHLFTNWFGTRAASADPAVEVDDPGRTATSRTAELVVNALGLLGISYRLGGNTPASGFDCSGMVRYVFQNAVGLSLPRRAEEISRVGTKISRDELKPGDLVFYKTLRKAFSHVGIYLGNNRFIHAPSSGGAVRVDDMGEHYWSARFTGARRIDS